MLLEEKLSHFEYVVLYCQNQNNKISNVSQSIVY